MDLTVLVPRKAEIRSSGAPGRTRASSFLPSSPVCTLLCPCPHLHPVPPRPFSQLQSVANFRAISPPPQAPRGSNAPVTTKHFPLALSLTNKHPLAAALKEESGGAQWLRSPHSLSFRPNLAELLKRSCSHLPPLVSLPSTHRSEPVSLAFSTIHCSRCPPTRKTTGSARYPYLH